MAFDNDALSMPSPNAAPISGPMPAPIAPAPDMSPAPAAPMAAATDTSTDAGPRANLVPPTGAGNGPSKYGASDAPQRPWMQILQGALWGLSGVHKEGRGGFGLGVAQGVQGYTGMKFASAKAAMDYILAKKQSEEADLSIKEHKLNLALTSAAYDAWAKRNGMPPIGTVGGDNGNDMHSSAVGMMGTIAQANGNVLPGITTTDEPMEVGDDPSKHETRVYAPTVPATYDSISKTVDPHTTSVPNMVNEARKAMGQLPLTDSQWAQSGVTPEMAGPTPGAVFKASTAIQLAQKGAVEDAAKFFNTPSLEVAKGASAEDIEAANRPVVSRLEQDIENYKARGGDQPETLKALTQRLETFKTKVDNAQDKAITDTQKRVLAGGGTQADADALYRSLGAKLQQSKPLSDNESAWMTTYEKQKTLVQQATLAAGTMTSEAKDMAAKQFLTTGNLPSYGFGPAGTKAKMDVMNRAAEIAKADPTYAGLAPASAAFAANKKTYSDLNDTLSKLQAFEAAAGANIDNFLALTSKLPDSGIPWLNTPLRQIDEKAVGAEWLPAIRAAKAVGLREVARVTNDPKMSGQLTDTARDEVNGLSPDDATVPQMKHVMNLFRTDMKNVEEGLAHQRDYIGGRLTQPTNPAINPPMPPAKHEIGDLKTFANGNVGKWDGKGFVLQPKVNQ